MMKKALRPNQAHAPTRRNPVPGAAVTPAGATVFRWFVSCWITASLLFATGCGSPFEDDLHQSWIDHDPASWRVSNTGALHRADTLRAEPGHNGLAVIANNTGPEDYVALALRRNAAIRRAEQQVHRLTERIEQVTSLDDPMATVAPIGEMAETAEGQVGVMSSISQKLPFPGKLDTRGRIAEREVAMAVQALNDTKLRVVADTRRAYWSHYFATRAIEVVERDRGLLGQFKDVAQTKYEVGAAAQQDVLRALVELSNLDNELLTLRQRQTTAAAMLNRQLDRPIDAAVPEPRAVELDRLEMNLDALLAEAARQNPRLERVRERIAMFRQRLKLARLNRWPDLTVGLTYNAVDNDGRAMSATGQDQWWLSFGVNLPIWQAKRDAAEREAMRGIFEGLADLTDQSNQIAFRVQDALIRVETQQRLVILFRDVIIPQARQTVEASESSYRAGRADFLTLVDNWRKLLDFEMLYHKSLAQLEQDFAGLQREVGRTLNRDGTTGRETHEEPSHD